MWGSALLDAPLKVDRSIKWILMIAMKSRVVPVSARFIDVLGRRKNVASWHVDQNNCMRPNKHGVVHLVYYIHKQNLFWGGFSRCRGTRENTLIILLCVLLMSLAWFIYKKTGAGCWVGRTDGRTASVVRMVFVCSDVVHSASLFFHRSINWNNFNTRAFNCVILSFLACCVVDLSRSFCDNICSVPN